MAMLNNKMVISHYDVLFDNVVLKLCDTGILIGETKTVSL